MFVINLWGAPSSGKSTTAAGLFFQMKTNGFKTELVHEFAKELVLDRQEHMFANQNYILAEQERRLTRIQSHGYAFAITDSPLLLPLFYDRENVVRNPHFEDFALHKFHAYNNINYLLKREHLFEDVGRRHGEQRSMEIATEMTDFLNHYAIPFTPMEATPKTPERILEHIKALVQDNG